MVIHKAKPEHEAAYQDMVALIRKHADKMTPLELLAVGANMLGKLLALQDQRVTSKELALETISRNIEHGNQQVIETLTNSTQGRG